MKMGDRLTWSQALADDVGEPGEEDELKIQGGGRVGKGYDIPDGKGERETDKKVLSGEPREEAEDPERECAWGG